MDNYELELNTMIEIMQDFHLQYEKKINNNKCKNK